MGSLSERNRAKKEERLLRLKHELVANLYLRRGAFWEAIRDMRSRWNVSVEVGIPPAYPDPPSPQNWPEQVHEKGGLNKERVKLSTRWGFDLDALRDQHVPEQHRDDFYDVLGWRSFMAACVLYDPPETRLLEFADFGGPSPVGIVPKQGQPDSGFEPEYVLLPSVKQHRDWLEATHIEMWRYEEVLHRLGERLGFDLRKMARDVMPELQEDYRELLEERAPFRRYIEVDEHTTAEDVEVARRAIQASEKKATSQGGKPAVDPLVALQSAILHEEHSDTDPEDRRVKRWAYKRLAAEFSEFGIKNERSAREHVNFGKNLREHS